jgi:hypothetical protein
MLRLIPALAGLALTGCAAIDAMDRTDGSEFTPSADRVEARFFKKLGLTELGGRSHAGGGAADRPRERG